MSANRHRGEIEAGLDGAPHRLCLTLGALAELESAFGVDDLNALAARFGQGRFSARDLGRLIGAGLRGAGEDVGDEDVMKMSAAGGVGGFALIVKDLLEATFGGGTGAPPNPL